MYIIIEQLKKLRTQDVYLIVGIIAISQFLTKLLLFSLSGLGITGLAISVLLITAITINRLGRFMGPGRNRVYVAVGVEAHILFWAAYSFAEEGGELWLLLSMTAAIVSTLILSHSGWDKRGPGP